MKWQVMAVVVVLAFAVSIFADTIKLKSGEVIEGKIISDNGTVVAVRVANASGTIFSVKEVPVASIQEIKKVSESEAKESEAILAARHYKLNTYSYPLAYYDNVISNVFLSFLKEHPSSSYRQEVQSAIEQWSRECDEVSNGNMKWNNQWYRGEAVKSVTSAIQATQFIDEGDRHLQLGKYEAAIESYRKALNPRPIQAEIINLIESRTKNAFTRWLSLPFNPEAELRSKRYALERLQLRLEADDQKIGVIQRELSCIRTAQLNKKRHWVVLEDGKQVRDFGAVLPDENSYIAKSNLAGLKTDMAETQTEMAKINAFISNYSATAISNQIHAIEADCLVAINNAKAELLSQKDAEKTATTSADVAVAQTNQVTAEAAPAPVVETKTSQEPVAEQPATKQPFWREYWYLILIGIVGAVFILRRL